jgi:hypothetical protein
VVFRHRRWVNGVAYWFLKIEATVDAIPMVYWGYFYVGESGTVQSRNIHGEEPFADYEQSFTDFLSGLTFAR